MHEDLYRRWLDELWGNGNESVATELIAEDLIDHNALPDQPAGREGQLWAARAIRNAFPDMQFTADVVFGSGDLVTGRWTMTGTHTGALELVGIPATGRPVTMSGQEIFRVRDGKFVEVWHVEDTGQLMRALEMQPPKLALKMGARKSARSYRKSLKAQA